MRILAFSDLHRDKEAARAVVDAAGQADVVVGAGDFATRGIGLGDTLDVLAAITAPMVLVAGNHEGLDEMRHACRDRPGVHVLHGEARIIQGMSFFGLGFEVPAAPDYPWRQGLEEAEAGRLLAACPPGAILVTHSPPFGVGDLQTTGAHVGSHAIREAVMARRPRLHLCGHIHNGWGTSGMIGQCPVHNLGPTVNWFSVD
ncbi:MAG: metallophosphoesterase [Rhizobiales bacterium]|nr:metallophosphoesterase [Hyphomicrobiales bacterium]